MPWVKTADRLPPDGVEVNASNRQGTIMPMSQRGGHWFYRISNRPTKFDIVMWFEGAPLLKTEEVQS